MVDPIFEFPKGYKVSKFCKFSRNDEIPILSMMEYQQFMYKLFKKLICNHLPKGQAEPWLFLPSDPPWFIYAAQVHHYH